jgi:hypothetical protein
MPRPWKFTERAVTVMREFLGKQEREAQQVIRMLIYPQGDITPALDIPREGDQRVKHQGDTVLVVESSICACSLM